SITRPNGAKASAVSFSGVSSRMTLSYLETCARGSSVSSCAIEQAQHLTDISYPRNLAGYGPTPPHAAWPGGARIAVQLVLNHEEGAEANVLDGDPASEIFLSDIANAAPVQGARHMSMEQIYEYGARAGVWRLLRLFDRYQVPVTVFGVALAMQRNPAAVEAFLKAGHEIASHGWRWINYQWVPEDQERADMARAIE